MGLAMLADDYNRDGFVVLRKVFSNEEVAVMAEECERLLGLDLVDRQNIRTLSFWVGRIP